MILKGSQRGGGRQLAAHLMNAVENDHVTLQELRGFLSTNLQGALAEAHAVSLGTKCTQFMFSLSLNPPKDAECGIEELVSAADRAEEALGLSNQPRAIVVHEKQGRRHIHVVWSRIDSDEMKAINLPFFKTRLASLSKQLYLDHGWELPEGHRENGWKNPLNFTLAEWQQAKRIGLDPKELKQLFADAWRYSDGAQAFKAVLEDRGYFLAQGTRRAFVAVDIHGEVHAVARLVGIKTKELEARLGSLDRLPGVAQVQTMVRARLDQVAKLHLHNTRDEHREALRPLLEERTKMVEAQRAERNRLLRLQEERRSREASERQTRFAKGVRGIWEFLSGKSAIIRRENERLAYEAHVRDLRQREALFLLQQQEAARLHQQIGKMRHDHRRGFESIVQHVMALTGHDRRPARRNAGRELSRYPA